MAQCAKFGQIWGLPSVPFCRILYIFWTCRCSWLQFLTQEALGTFHTSAVLPTTYSHPTSTGVLHGLTKSSKHRLRHKHLLVADGKVGHPATQRVPCMASWKMDLGNIGTALEICCGYVLRAILTHSAAHHVQEWRSGMQTALQPHQIAAACNQRLLSTTRATAVFDCNKH